MSRHNKVNRDAYTQRGRLTPDDLARERQKQSEPHMGAGRAGARKATPPWMANQAGTDNDGVQEGAGADPGDAADQIDDDRSDDARDAGGGDSTLKTGKAPRATAVASRGASPQRAGKPGARKAASSGTQKKAAAATRKSTAAKAGGGSASGRRGAKAKSATSGGGSRAAKTGAARGGAARSAKSGGARGATKTGAAKSRRTTKGGTRKVTKR